MPDQSLGTFDKLILAGSLCGAVIFGFALWRDDLVLRYFVQSQTDAKVIGEIISAKNDVRRRLSQSLAWYQAGDSEKLFERDSVFTGNDSEVEIKIGADQSLNLSANSLVVLQTSNNEIVFDLQVGSLAANPGRETLKVAYQGKVTEVSSAGGGSGPVLIRKDTGGQLNIVSQSGDIDVKIQGQKTRIKKDESLSVEKDLKVKKVSYPVKITSHKLRDRVWLKADEPLHIEWKGAKADAPVKLQIATDARFQTLSLDEPTTQTHLDWAQVQPGPAYYYRVIDAQSGEALSLTHLLTVNEKSSVVLQFPKPQAELSKDVVMEGAKTQPVRFQWQAKKDIDRYRLEVSQTPDFDIKTPGATRILRAQQARAAADLRQGRYYWRVRTDGAPTDDLWSETREFTLGRAPEAEKTPGPLAPADTLKPTTPLVAEVPTAATPAPVAEKPASTFAADKTPVPRAQAQKVVLDYKPNVDTRSPASVAAALKNPPVLSWKPLPGANEYAVEIARDKAFTSPVKLPAVKETEVVWREATPGDYYWRVRGQTESGEVSSASAPAKLAVRLASPELEPLEVPAEKVEDPAQMVGGKVVTARWKKVPTAEAYRVIAGETNVITTNDHYDIELKPNEAKEIRIAAVDAKGRALGEVAKQDLKFERVLSLRIPEVSLPADNTTVVSFSKDAIDPLLFSWKTSLGAKEYELQFAADRDFKNVLAEERVPSNKFVLKKRLPGEEVYWRVRARHQKDVSKWSAPRKYEIQQD